MYKKTKYRKSGLKSIEKLEGEPLEWKIERIVTNREPITDGAPVIFTERKDGVQPQYDVRTDRWEIAAEAMDAISRNKEAKREGRAAKKEAEKEAIIVKMEAKKEESGGQSTNGTTGEK